MDLVYTDPSDDKAVKRAANDNSLDFSPTFHFNAEKSTGNAYWLLVLITMASKKGLDFPVDLSKMVMVKLP